MSKKILFQEIESQLSSQGIFIIRNPKKSFENFQFTWKKMGEQFALIRKQKKMKEVAVLCDFVIEKDKKIVIGTSDLDDLKKGQIRIGENQLFQFEQSDIKESNVVCICCKDMPLNKALEALSKNKPKKSKKLNKQNHDCLIKKTDSKLSQKQEDPPCLLPKKIIKCKQKQEQMEIQQIDSKRTEKGKRKLLLKSSSSENQEFHFNDKHSQIALFSMHLEEKIQTPRLQQQEEKKIAIDAQTSQVKTHELRGRTSKDSKDSNKNSIGKIQGETKKGKQSHKSLDQKGVSKKLKAQKAQKQIEQQSKFMSKWIHKAQ